MKLHKEGNKILISVLTIFLAISAGTLLISNNIFLFSGITFLLILCYLFFIQFFRFPDRIVEPDNNRIYSPADGYIVTVENTEEKEYFKEKKKQVSIFMTIWDAHVNWIPIEGTITYYAYHPGKYLIAKHPKSSELNERNTTVIKTSIHGEILLRQIAGTVARRIVCYIKKDEKVKQNQQLGFIKFGSRVDLFLPLDASIEVKLGQHVKGNQTVIAQLSKDDK